MDFEPVIGLEVHAQLATKSKIFCSCSTEFGSKPNSNTCPVCTGMPGVLPVLNKKVVEYSIKAALATGCSIAPESIFSRKNYFYPDLPKGYQISQYDKPIAQNGFVDISVDGKHKRIGLTRIHIEEDAGKLIHGENLGDPECSYVDLNRTGVPLIEIVSEPELRSAKEAKEYLSKLKSILEYLEVCDCNMEEGSLRCDANVSVRRVGAEKFGTRAELKNMNSFKNVQKAIDYEIERQIELIEDGEEVVQESRLWDAGKGISLSMRGKEDAHDYRYFPEPDLTPLLVSSDWVERVRETLPELPDAKKSRFITEYKIPEYDAEVLTASKKVANYYEDCVKLLNNPKSISNWVMGDILRELKNDNKDIEDCPVTPKHLTDMLKMIEKNVISGKIAKTVFEDMYKTGDIPEDIVKKKGLVQITDEGEIIKIIDEIIASNAKQVEKYRSGKDQLFGFFVGQAMKMTKGKANPQVVNKLLKEMLNKKS